MVPGHIAKDGQLEVGIETDEDGCAMLCSMVYKEECCSYEYSPKEKTCNLNKNCKPTEEQTKDFKLCVESKNFRTFMSAKS